MIFVLASSIVAVCASDLVKENDFDGKFKMNISENSTFVEVVDGVSAGALLSD